MLKSVAMVASLLGAALFASTALAQAPQAVPRTVDGHSDLSGIWTNANLTPVSRPRGQTKLVVTEAEARSIATNTPIAGVPRSQAGLEDRIDPNQGAPEKGGSDFGAKGYNSFWLSTGDNLARVKGEYRTSNIIDPPNGQIPHKDPAAVMAKARTAGIVYMTGVSGYEGPEIIGIPERCLLGFSGAAGPGILTPMYNNNYQFVLTKDFFVIMVEMVHDARIVPLFASAEEARKHHKPNVIKPWMGDSVGWWDGDTLVVDSINVNPTQGEQGVIAMSPKGKVTERFQRYAADEVFYSFTVDDPDKYTQPWTVENSFRPQKALYEYACAEGNVGLPGILRGKRIEEERLAAEAKAKAATVSAKPAPGKAKP
jgi:hypothetical protein